MHFRKLQLCANQNVLVVLCTNRDSSPQDLHIITLVAQSWCGRLHQSNLSNVQKFLGFLTMEREERQTADRTGWEILSRGTSPSLFYVLSIHSSLQQQRTTHFVLCSLFPHYPAHQRRHAAAAGTAPSSSGLYLEVTEERGSTEQTNERRLRREKLLCY